MIVIAKHIPALQILLPFFGALLCGISFNNRAARWIALLVIFANFVLSIFCLQIINNHLPTLSYIYGNWLAYAGIEYVLDYFNQPLIVLINGILLFIIIFCDDYIIAHVLKYIDHGKKHLFYSILLFAHTGYMGMLSTNDLFNLYVFIEISSLSSYVLFAQGRDREALTNSLNYLIVGTISATLILIGIGFLFSVTGHLNMSYVASLLFKDIAYTNLRLVSIGFIIVGCLLKIGIFPMHRWLVDAYKTTPAIILSYLAIVSSIVGTYLFLRLGYFINYEAKHQLMYIFRPITAFTLIYCGWQASRTDNFKMLLGYAAISQIGMVLLILTYPNSKTIAYKFLCIDSLSKLSLFLIATFYENNQKTLNFSKMLALHINILSKCLISLILLYSVGLPFSAMFILKIAALNLAIDNSSYIIFVVLVLSNLLSLQYHYKIFKNLILKSTNSVKNEQTANNLPLAILVMLQLISLFYLDYNPEWLEFKNYLK